MYELQAQAMLLASQRQQEKSQRELQKLEKQAGLRFNQGKLPYHLLPEDAIKEVVKVLAEGAKKYEDRNWQKGLKWDSETAASLQRHLAAWKLGEDVDPEDGMLHVAKIAVNALFLTHFYLQNVGDDDRFVYGPSECSQYSIEMRD